MSTKKRFEVGGPEMTRHTDTERLDYLIKICAQVVFTRQGDRCWLHWPGYFNQEGCFDSPRAAIDAAIDAKLPYCGRKRRHADG
jgi:hypothetical protein